MVAGPDTRAHLSAGPPGTRCVGLRFAPGTGPAVLGIPAHQLRDQRVPLAALWPEGEVRRLAERLAEECEAIDRGHGTGAAPGGGAGPRAGSGYPGRKARGPGARVVGPGGALEAVASDRLRDAEPMDPALRAAVRVLARGRSVAAVADAVGLGERQLHRRSLAAFGYGPKTLGRVLRLQRALASARAGAPFAEVAAVAGYADQAHLAREVKDLAGIPLRRLLVSSD